MEEVDEDGRNGLSNIAVVGDPVGVSSYAEERIAGSSGFNNGLDRAGVRAASFEEISDRWASESGMESEVGEEEFTTDVSLRDFGGIGGVEETEVEGV